MRTLDWIAGCALALAACVGDTQATTDAGSDATTDSPSPSDATTDIAASDVATDAAPSDASDSSKSDPSTIAGASLQLWLTSDQGLTCETTTTPNRVTGWADQSGHNRNATPASAKGPQCNVHSVNAIDVPYLSAPGSASPYNDEIFDVDLTFLLGSPYTIAIVEKRWTDKSAFAALIGTLVPGEAQDDPGDHDKALDFGFTTGNLVVDQYYDRMLSYGVSAAPETSAHFVVAWFEPSTGHRLYIDGNDVADALSDAGSPLLAAQSGTIGAAAYINAFDGRFAGDIAEVIVANGALSPSSLNALGAYVKKHWGLSF